jgi:hypothetical protein
MRRSTTLWGIAFLLTVITAYYQRVTGPTYPLTGTTGIGGSVIEYRLDRSHGGKDDAVVRLTARESVRGTLVWRRYKTGDPWAEVEMRREGEGLTASLPAQPPAGKLEYFLRLRSDASTVIVPAKESVVIRFRGDVPGFILMVHILTMFGGMFLSLRTALESFRPVPAYGGLVKWTLALLLVGGLILGPVVQKYAFDAYWTGWPFGTDLTDNKTLVAFLGWAAAAFALRKGAHPGRWVWGAATLTLAVFLIPHSVLGSELKYQELDKEGKGRPARVAPAAKEGLDSTEGKR